MNRGHLINKVAKEAGVSKVKADKMIDSFIAGVVEALKKEQKVTLKGFGTLQVSKYKERNGRNPQTGDPIKIKSKKRVRFSSGKRLDTILNREIKGAH